MGQERYIEAIGKAWNAEGFLGSMKDGKFDRGLFRELLSSLRTVQIAEDEQIERELIRVLWFIPVFMYRFQRYFPEVPANEHDTLRELVETELERIFQYP